MNPDTADKAWWRVAIRAVLAALIVCGGALAGRPLLAPGPDHDDDPFDTYEGDGAS